jgi:hypothetical protein
MENLLNNDDEEQFLSNIDKKQPFLLPNDYFNNLTEQLLNKIACEEELTDYKTLSNINKETNFRIPENYFENLKNKLEYKYEISNYKELEKISKNLLNKPSKDYFEKSENKIKHKLELESELQEFKTLNSLEKKNPFHVDIEYFEKRNQKQTEETKTKNKEILILLHPKLAIAASILLITGAIAFWKLNSNSETIIQPSDCKTLACLEKNELLNEKNVEDFNDENLYEMVDIEALDKKLGTEDNTNDTIRKDERE